MGKNRLAVLFSTTLLLLANAGIEAQDEATNGATSFSASVTLTTDYVWRGISQSDGDLAIQGSFEIDTKGFYVGTWGSNVDFSEASVDDADLELDIYLGYRRDVGENCSFDVGLLEYAYPGSGIDLDWIEGYLNFGWRRFGLGINYSDDVLATDTSGLFLVLSYAHPLGEAFEVAADVAQYSLESSFGDRDSYLTGSLALTWSGGPFATTVTYSTTDSNGEALFGDWAGDRFVFSLSASM